MIEGKRLKLRPIISKDLSIFRDWINDWDICRGLLRYLPVTDFEHREWFKKLKQDKKQIYFAIEIKRTKRYIGNIGLRNINWKDRNGDFFIYIGKKKEWSNGYGREATKLFIDYCFNILNLHKVYLRVVGESRMCIPCSGYER